MRAACAEIAPPQTRKLRPMTGNEAIARGVFGVPTLVIDDELFWGADATLMAADFVADGCRWTDPQSDRAAAVPVGAVRRDPVARAKPAKRAAR